ncbi:NAD(P)/FAD-dependent oxidoreductase [Fictibacillus sp. WQ 8-8]|uniref:flavin-containing monooxygenase n=1 Tax=Fictibacillus sp. WQ 8-8 TaxID=2938788 RepID=UPI002109074A|nr:NAD(P)/FAD-dependent oxidoreductase [Fictibacillus sp. WQ 8-8]MCQ6268872.1 NAD(P)/FAD-dependent oxidoreductase [Fictibacillus sp. WQ 8-8]
MENPLDCLVIGAGQAGLAAGYHIQKRGWNYVILEASHQPAGSWPSYYDSLTLFSPARFSSLPGYRFPGEPDRYPTRDEVISYLTNYAEHFNFNVVTNENVQKVIKDNGLFKVETASGKVFAAKTVISATGAFAHPFIPEMEGFQRYKGRILHSSQYRNTEEFEGKRMVVVGGGNSAVQIAYELTAVAQVTLATRRPLSFMPQTFLGKDLHFWLTVSGIDKASFAKHLGTSVSVLDTGIYQEAISNQKPDHRNLFSSFTEDGVNWGEEVEKVDAVIFATGFRPNLSYLHSLPQALGKDGFPQHIKGMSTSINGLGYVGLSGQRSLSSATIRGGGRDANYVIKRLAKEKESQKTLQLV